MISACQLFSVSAFARMISAFRVVGPWSRGPLSFEDGERRTENGSKGPGIGRRKPASKQRMIIQSAKELEVYEMAYVLAMRIFELSKRFPAEERWALTGQIRRSSRSVCMNLREAWAKRRYEAHFLGP